MAWWISRRYQGGRVAQRDLRADCARCGAEDALVAHYLAGPETGARWAVCADCNRAGLVAQGVYTEEQMEEFGYGNGQAKQVAEPAPMPPVRQHPGDAPRQE